MLCRVSPGATTWVPEPAASALRGGPTGTVEGIACAFVAIRVCGAETLAAGP